MFPRFGGLWPALVTPFTPDGQVAFPVLERLVELFVSQRMEGLYITGSTGQWPLLTLDERRAIAECVVGASRGRTRVMVHVGAAVTEQAVELARHAGRIGADAVAAIAPIYYAHSPDVVFDYYRQIGAATELPLFVYHLDMVGKISLGVPEYAQRLLSIPNIAGMKITSLDLYLLGQIRVQVGDRLFLFSGADEVFCNAILSGSNGAIGTFYNVWGPACQRAWESTRAGSSIEGREFMPRFQTALARVLGSGGVWSFIRAAMQRKYDLDIGRPRPPLGALDRPWDDAELSEIVALVDNSSAP